MKVFPLNKKTQLFDELKTQTVLSEDSKLLLKASSEKFKRIMIVPGQQRPNPQIQALLDKLILDKKAVVITDVISNLQTDHTIAHHELFIQPLADTTELSPDLIISFGKSILSKSLKLLLRKSEASHWHIQTSGHVPDTFQHLSKIIPSSPLYLLRLLDETLGPTDSIFFTLWQNAESRMKQHFPEIMDGADFGEFKALYECLKHIPSPSKVHLANSMPVRYTNFVGIRNEQQEIICNRGTSGIDGSNSTAVGCVFTTKDPVVLVTGDMAFFYDRNAFWHKYSMPNLRVILLNNHAGGIFRLIAGPSQQAELEEFFETTQSLNGRLLAQEHGFIYHHAEAEANLKEILKDFYHPSVSPKILEITSESKQNAEILKQIKASVRQVMIDHDNVV